MKNTSLWVSVMLLLVAISAPSFVRADEPVICDATGCHPPVIIQKPLLPPANR